LTPISYAFTLFFISKLIKGCDREPLLYRLTEEDHSVRLSANQTLHH